jgi:hypothetical protein
MEIIVKPFLLTSTIQPWFILVGVEDMVKTARKTYINTTVDSNILRSLKVLAAQKDKRLNQLLEEAITDLLKKYEKEAPKE